MSMGLGGGLQITKVWVYLAWVLVVLHYFLWFFHSFYETRLCSSEDVQAARSASAAEVEIRCLSVS